MQPLLETESGGNLDPTLGYITGQDLNDGRRPCALHGLLYRYIDGCAVGKPKNALDNRDDCVRLK